MKPKDTAQQKCETWAAAHCWKPSHFNSLIQTLKSFQLIHSMWLTLSVSPYPVWDLTFPLSRACRPPAPHYNATHPVQRARTLNLMPIKGVFFPTTGCFIRGPQSDSERLVWTLYWRKEERDNATTHLFCLFDLYLIKLVSQELNFIFNDDLT